MTFKETILQQAATLFMKNGFAQYTVPQIAKELDISQATFDDFFKDKDDLVIQAINFHSEKEKKRQAQLTAKAENAAEEILLLIADGLETMKGVSPQYYADFFQHPQLLQIMHNELENYSYPQMHNLLNKGVQQGVFLRDINIAIVTRVIIENINVLLNSKVFPADKYSLREVYKSIYLYYIRGLCTEDAIRNAEKIFSRTIGS